MKISIPVNASAQICITPLQKPVKVCMHVVRQARDDVRVMRAAEALAAGGFAVCVVDVESDATRPAEELLQGVCFKHLAVSREFVATRFTKWTLFRAIRMFFRSVCHLLGTHADIYHAHNEVALPACAIAAWLRRKPLIFEAHELPLNYTSIRWPWLLALFNRMLKLVVPRCSGVISVSPPIAHVMSERYHPRSVTLIRNIPPYQQVEQSDRLRQALRLGPQIRLALYQGALQEDRGLENLIYAARFLEPDTVIVLMGPGEENMQKYLAGIIASEGVEDRVKLLPPVPYRELLTWTASADLGLVIFDPTYTLKIKLCLPNKLFEYLMAGLPVLSSELVAVTELLQMYRVGKVVSSLEPRAVGMAINTLLADQVTLAEMRINALQAAREVFCWEQEHKHLLNLYHTIVTHQEGNL